MLCTQLDIAWLMLAFGRLIFDNGQLPTTPKGSPQQLFPQNVLICQIFQPAAGRCHNGQFATIQECTQMIEHILRQIQERQGWLCSTLHSWVWIKKKKKKSTRQLKVEVGSLSLLWCEIPHSKFDRWNQKLKTLFSNPPPSLNRSSDLWLSQRTKWIYSFEVLL